MINSFWSSLFYKGFTPKACQKIVEAVLNLQIHRLYSLQVSIDKSGMQSLKK